MKIRKFIAKSMPQALRQVREDLGEEAIILSSRKVRQKSRVDSGADIVEDGVEVTAAVDETPVQAVVIKDRRGRPSALASRLRSTAAAAAAGAVPAVEARLGNVSVPANPPVVPQRWKSEAAASASPTEPRSGAGSAAKHDVAQQLRRLQDMVARMERRATSQLIMPTEMNRVGERLASAGLCDALVRNCLRSLFRHMDEEGLADRSTVASRIVSALDEQLPERRDIRIGSRRKIVALVGAPGSGKTTAAVKIAAGFAAKLRRKQGEHAVVLITADGRRVGAVDQAKAYSQITGVPVEVAYDEADMRAVLERWKGAKLVLIDTAGCAPQERVEHGRQRQLLQAAKVDEVHIVIDAATDSEHMLDVIDASADLPNRRLLFTKMDQVTRPGALLSAAARSGLPTSYFTNSPGPPGGIEPGNLAELTKSIVGISGSAVGENGVERPDVSRASAAADRQPKRLQTVALQA